MKRELWKRTAVRALGPVAGALAVVASVWLLATFVHARLRLPVEKARIESLKERARTDASVQEVLKPELDRQRDAAVARRRVYEVSSWAALVAGFVFLAWYHGLREPRAPASRAVVSRGRSLPVLPDAPPREPGRLGSFPPRDERVPVDLAAVDEILTAEGRSPEAAIPVLQAIQARYRYLPEAALRRVADRSEITPQQLAGLATFYGQFRLAPVGEHVIRVCEGTACHVAGAVEVGDELRRCLGIRNGCDTDPGGRFTIERVACLGSCSLAPLVSIDERNYGHVSALSAGGVVRRFLEDAVSAQARPRRVPAAAPRAANRMEIRIGLGSCGVASGAERVRDALEDVVSSLGDVAVIKAVGCGGFCHREPLVEVVGNGISTLYGNVRPEDVRKIVRRHTRAAGVLRKGRAQLRDLRARLVDDGSWVPPARQQVDPGPFLGKQVRVVLENCGVVDPLSLEEYRSRGGMSALEQCLAHLTPEDVIERVRASGLRGRGGAGFPTAVKWAVARQAPGPVKYVIANGDEGDPGAFMDRAVLEGDPFRVVEGLILAAFAIGAPEGFVYVRREYPIAVRHVREAIRRAEEHGFLGEDLLGSGFSFTLRVREGAGAFVCGEETALIRSLEGGRGTPRLRPPFPAEAGLHGRPTLINNVETLACVPSILLHGAERFAAVGNGGSRGTKVFALAGKVERGGLIEVPMGITIREIVEDIGGGVVGGRPLKAVLVGGPSGGCIPARLADTPIDFEELRATGAIMGSGGLVVLDDRDCAVDIARYFLHFTESESCGKCVFCRVGTKRMLEILERICAGNGRESDLGALEDLAGHVRRASLCGLGQTAPNPVSTTLLYFRDEYEAHVRERRCPAGRCKALIRFRVRESCTGCTLCAQACPVDAIKARPYEAHVVEDERCTRCGMCLSACPEGAIEVA